MEGIFLYLHLLILQQAVFPVTTQTVTLTTEGTFVEDSPGTFHCEFTGAWNAGSLRLWIGPGSATLINGGLSSDSIKYQEDISDANAANRFSMTIQPYTSIDEGSYQCQYEFVTSKDITLDKSNTEVHPSTFPLSNIVMQDATNAIDLTIPVSGIRPNASASFNLTSSAGALKVSGDAVVTVTDDGNGRTFSSSLKIDVPADEISANDVFTITLRVGTYSQTKSWTIPGGKSDVSLGLLITDIILFVIYMPLYWFVVVTTKDKDKIWGMEYSNVAAIIITVIGVISVILCGVGYGISDTQKSTGEALSIVGFVIGVLMLIATIFIVIQAKFTVINKKKCGKEDPKTGNNTISPGNTNATDDQKGQQNDERPEQLEILNQKNSPDKSQRKKSEIIEASEKEKCTDKKGDPV